MKIVVAVPTRRRPEMLASCLRSLAALQVPVGFQLQVVVVENDMAEVCKQLVNHLAQGHVNLKNLIYKHEPRLGISTARNACIHTALEVGADFLAFIDDDETVAPNWLQFHMAAMEQQNADLLGGPVRLAKSEYELNWVDRILFKALEHRYMQVELKALAISNAASSKNTTVHTNNWVCKTSIFENHGIFFNEDLGQTGGEDTVFFNDCVRMDLRVGWVPNAVVWDHLPKSRLGIRYQYERSRDHSNAYLHYKLQTKSTSVWGVIGTILLRFIYLPFYLVLLLIMPSKFCLQFIRNVGWMKGRLDALLGKRHAHYKITTGA